MKRVHHRIASVLAIGYLLALESCHQTGIEYRSRGALPGPQGASVVLSSDSSFRLVVTPRLRDAPSRLWVIYARIETFDDMPLRIDSDAIQLSLADGTHARALDQPRIAALLKRTEIGAGRLSALQPTSSFPVAGSLTDVEKTRVRGEILSRPLVAGELTRSHPIEGYLVVDTQQELGSLEGATLEVVATRLRDGTFVRRTYQFPAPEAGLQANATTADR